MPLHDNRPVPGLDQPGRGHRPGTMPQHDRIALAEHATNLVVGERRPVRCDEFLAHAVHGMTGHLRITPVARVAAAATANDRIDADIQGCAVKWMSRAIAVHIGVQPQRLPS